MGFKFILRSFLILIIFGSCDIFSPILISGQDTTHSKQGSQFNGKTCHQRPKEVDKFTKEIHGEENYCDDVKLEPTQTYVVPIDELDKGLFRPILPPEGSMVPPWINVTLYNEGILFSRKHFFSVFLFPIAAMPLFLSNPLITPLLMATGKSSTPSTSNRRFIATVLHMKLWYENLLKETEDEENLVDPSSGDELLNSFVLQSLYNIRSVHFMLIKKHPYSTTKNHSVTQPRQDKNAFITNPDLWEAYNKDLEDSDIPREYREWPQYIKNLDGKTSPPHYLNQLSLGITQFFLGGLQTLMPERGGIIADEKEHEAFMHMWAVFGYAIGIEDQFNVALQPSLAAAKEYYQEMMKRFLYPSLFWMTKNPDAQLLYEAFVKGFAEAVSGGEEGRGNRALSEEQFMLLAFEDVVGIPCPNLRARLSFGQKMLRDIILSNAIGMISRSDWVREFMNHRFKSKYCGDGGRRALGIDANDMSQIVDKSYA